MEILQRFNENNRRQAITSYNLNLITDHSTTSIIKKDSGFGMSQNTRNRISSNYTEIENECNESQEELKLDDFSEMQENNQDESKITDKFKRNTFSTLDPLKAQEVSAKFQEVIKTRVKSPKKNVIIPVEIPESDENNSEESVEGFSSHLKKIKLIRNQKSSASSSSSNSCVEEGQKKYKKKYKQNNNLLIIDCVKIYKFYFPHNNVNRIFETIKNIEKIKMRRVKKRNENIQAQNKKFWNFFKLKNVFDYVKKAKQLEKSLKEIPIDEKTSKNKGKNIYENDSDFMHKQIFRKIRASEKKDSIVLQILKEKQKKIN